MYSLRPDLEFFVNNHRDIAAILDIRQRATEELPDQLARLLLEEIEIAGKKGNGWNSMPNFVVMSNDGHIGWSDESFLDRKKEHGIYFGIGPFSRDTIINAGGPQDGPFLYLGIAPPGNKSQKTKTIGAAGKIITANKGSLQSPGVRFGPLLESLDDQVYLAHQPMFDLLTLDKLCRDERVRTIEQIVERARKFSEAFAPVLPRLSSLGVGSVLSRGKRS
jgi:hypothetical protein